MAIKKTRFRPKGNDNYETIIHFETSADIVKTTDDSNVQSKLDELKNNYNNILNDIEDIQSELDSKETPSGAQAKADTAEANAKNYADTIVGIVDRNLETHKNDNVTVHGVARGISKFAGNGNEVTIPHGLGTTPTSAYAFPTSNPEGYLGEVWIRMDDTNLYIGNSGSFTGEMCWVAIK